MNQKNNLKIALSFVSVLFLCWLLNILVVTSMILFMRNTYLTIILQLVCFILVFFLIYCPLWVEGNKDKNKNLSKKDNILFDKFKGLKIGFYISIPYFIFNIFLILSRLGIIPNILVLYKIINPHIWPIIQLLSPNNSDIMKLNVLDMIIINLLPLMFIIISTIGYVLGFKGISLKQKIYL